MKTIIALFFMIGCAGVHKPVPKSAHAVKVEYLESGYNAVMRFENDEVVCYRSGEGLSCQWKAVCGHD